MRISTSNVFDAGVETLQKRQRELADAQMKLSSGKRVARASDDPAAAARAERALATIARSDAAQRALEASRNAMTLTESALGDAGSLVQQARELLVSAGNAGHGATERGAIAQHLAELRGQLLQVANRGDGAGGYLFAGQGAAMPPFLDAPGGVQYVGTSGHVVGAGTDALPLTVDGGAAWLQSRTGNGVFETRVATPNSGRAWIDSGTVTDPSAVTGSAYTLQFAVDAATGATTYSIQRDGAATAVTDAAYTAGQAITIDGISMQVAGAPADGDTFEAVPSTPSLSLFDTLDRAIAELKSGRSSTQVTQTVARSLRDIDSSLNTLLAARGAAGEALNHADAAESRNLDAKLLGQAERSNAEDLDIVAAVSEFQNKQTSYDAALKTYSMVQKLSLFDYIR